jgi:DNA-binding MarR family transcriptional regulator
VAVRKNESDVALSSSLLIEDQMCFALYAASRSITAVYRPLLEPLGLTYPQYLVMLVLWQRKACGIKEIATILRLDYGTLTPLLKKLEIFGVLTRQRRSDDERAVEVALTPQGVALRQQAAHIPVEISKALGLTAAQFADLLRLLRLISDNTAARMAGELGNG